MRYIFVFNKKCIKFILAAVLCIALIFAAPSGYKYVMMQMEVEDEIRSVLEDSFRQRGVSLVSGDPSFIEGQFDVSSVYGRWSYEHEIKRIKYIKEWSHARGAKFKECQSKLKIFSMRPGNNSVRVYLSVLTKFTYTYPEKDPDIINEFCLGTKHTITLVNKQDVWYITVDWYSDPLEDSGVAGAYMSEDIKEVEAFEYGGVRYNRSKAVEYADNYCGTNWDKEDGYKYNKKYRNYADLGGDCANFASQVLADKNAGNLKMGGGWLYSKGSGSKAWVNAGSFTRYMLYSGKARLVSRGKYNKVVNFTKYLSSGDIVAYEKKGDIVHVSVVTAKDSMGVPLVNSHTNDRYHVPWDLGWNSSSTFWLLRIND